MASISTQSGLACRPIHEHGKRNFIQFNFKEIHMKLLNVAVLAFSIGFSGAAAAHADEYLDTVKAPNGGQLRMAGAYHYELVIKPAGKGNANDVLVYVTDHANKEIDTKGATGTVTVLSGSKASVVLKPEGKNLMKGSGNFGLNPKLKAVVSIALPGQQPEQARFTPLAQANAAPLASGNAQDGHKH